VRTERAKLRQMELSLEFQRWTCARCGAREIYNDSRTMDCCSECLWDFIADDQEKGSAV
jgi:hypothetical protein